MALDTPKHVAPALGGPIADNFLPVRHLEAPDAANEAVFPPALIRHLPTVLSKARTRHGDNREIKSETLYEVHVTLRV